MCISEVYLREQVGPQISLPGTHLWENPPHHFIHNLKHMNMVTIIDFKQRVNK